MPARCCVRSCNNRPGSGVKLYRFPKDEALRQKWISAIGPSSYFSKYSVICSEHFDSSSIPLKYQLLNYFPTQVRFLKKDAVPTLKLSVEREPVTSTRSLKKGSAPTLTRSSAENEVQECIQPGAHRNNRIISDEKINQLQSEFTETERDLREICNLCLALGDLKPLTSARFAEKFNNFGFIEVQIGYKLPEKMCKSCLDKLDELGEFIKKCKSSYDILQMVERNCSTKPKKKSVRLPPSNVNTRVQVEVQDHVGSTKTENIVTSSNVNTRVHVEVQDHVGSTKTENIVPSSNVNRSVQIEVQDHVESTKTENVIYKKTDNTPVLSVPLNSTNLPQKKTRRRMPLYRRWSFVKAVIRSRNLSVKKDRNRDQSNKSINKVLICEKCGQMVTTGLTNHYKTNPKCKPRNYKCTLCNCYFHNLDKMHNHQKAYHWNKIIVNRFVCHICAKIFKYRSSLKRHLLLHEGGRRYMCELCGKLFVTAETLRNHINAHTNERPFSCAYCDKAFNSRAELSNHKKKHAGISKDSSFTSASFNQEFVKSTILKSQNERLSCKECTAQKLSKTQIGRKLFGCEYCQKWFLSKKGFKNHVLIHTRTTMETNFECETCGKAFSLQKNLNRHIVHAHKMKKSFKCHVCKKGFYYLHTRQRHIREVHGEEELENIENEVEN